MSLFPLLVGRTGPLLTQPQIDALPVGAYVEVIWSGGNGPHLYLIGRRYALTVAKLIPICGEVSIEVSPLERCGAHPLTQVRRFTPVPK